MGSFESQFVLFSACGPNLGVSEVRNFLLNLHNGQEHFACLYKKCHVFRCLLSGKLLFGWLPLAVMVTFSIVSLNVDGICDDDKRARIFEYLRSLKHGFFLLQETHVQTEDVEAWSAE